MQQSRRYTFGGSRVRPWLSTALREAGFRCPRPVQIAAMTRITRREDTVIHAETGSGKTLAFLVPILSRLEPGVPLQTLVLLPSRELALQIATEIEQLAPPGASGLHVALLVGGVCEEVGAERELAAAIAAQRAQVLVATPQALRYALNARPPADQTVRRGVAASQTCGVATGSGTWADARAQFRGDSQHVSLGLSYFRSSKSHRKADDGGSLLLGLRSNLDTIVLDEVDALLAKPVFASALFYQKRDWSSAGQMARRKARRGPTAALLDRLLQAVSESSLRPPKKDAAPGRHCRKLQHGPVTLPPVRRVQLVAVSATASNGVLSQLRTLFCIGRRQLGVVGKAGTVDDSTGGKKREANSSGHRGVAGVAVPSNIAHRVVAVDTHGDKPRAVVATLLALQPRSALIVLPDEAPLLRWVAELRAAGMLSATPLHEALGFPVRGASLEDGEPVTQLLRRASLSRGVRAHRRFDSGQRKPAMLHPSILVTTENSVRGLDLPSLEAVVLVYCPTTSDTYVHVAGRTGRGGDGVAVSVLRQEETRKLGLYSSQLKVGFQAIRGADACSNRFARNFI